MALLQTLSALCVFFLFTFESKAQVELIVIKDSTTNPQSQFLAFYCSDSVWVGMLPSSGLYVSTDFGNSWKKGFLGPGGGFSISGRTLFSGGARDAFTSLNLSQSWFKIGYSLAGPFDIYTKYEGLGMSTINDSLFIIRRQGYYLSPISQGSLYFHGIDTKTGETRDYGLIAHNTLLESKDMYSITGATFVLVSQQLLRVEHDSKIIKGCTLDSISVYPESILQTGTGTLLVGAREGLYRSFDNGLKWSKIITPLEPNIIRALTRKGNRIFAGLWPTGEVWLSENEGITWNRLYLPTFQRIEQIRVSGEYLAIVANDSLWRIPLASISTLGLQHLTNLTTLDCSPNPVKELASIKISFQKNSMITLKLFDVLGKQIEVFTNSELKSGGQYEYSFSVEHLQSGMYFLQLEAENVFLRRKIIVLK